MHNEAKDEDFRREIENLCAKYKSIFSTKLGKEPARIPPLVMDVVDERWELPNNKGPPQVKTGPKQI